MSNRTLNKYLRLFQKSALACFVIFAAILANRPAVADNPFIILQSTTSTQNSGLYDYLLPHFTAKSGIDVRVVAVGTGQALRNAEKCDGDVLVVHSKADEVKFVENGFGTKRSNLMYNDFVVLGPANDPANIASATTVDEALQRISASQSAFASRGDNSGTHKAEKRLWKAANIAIDSAVNSWYLETGLGMGATLNFAVQANAYTLSDRATWLAFANRAGHKILFQGQPPLFNQYGVVPVSKSHCPNVKHELAQEFTDWLVSPDGQNMIASYKRNGAQLFFPNAD
ncbi:MAG: substrate-binding domain-containing protein [Proteobacteria bacterium]|nr:substrate-binding domain-containing protein [Pseudomonadota bacterium]MDA0845279.1 substrate-binding domain-containing protein [Pseudomonadota bacterium]